MPDVNLAENLILTAKKLIEIDNSENNQADLRRAISTAYFAVFHALARASADGLVGDDRNDRPNRAWVEVYRGLSHGPCKEACERAKAIGFPEEIEGFANNFVQLQNLRKRVDYDPTCRPTVEEARQWISIADLSIRKLLQAEKNGKVAFATWVLITSPGAKLARNAVREKIGPALGSPT